MNRNVDEHLWGMYKVDFTSSFHDYTSDVGWLREVKCWELETRRGINAHEFEYFEYSLNSFFNNLGGLLDIIDGLDGPKQREIEVAITDRRVSLTASKNQIRNTYKDRSNELICAKEVLPELFASLGELAT